MSDVLDLMGPGGVNLAAELAMSWCKRGSRPGRDYLEFGTFRGKSFVVFFRAAEKYGLEDMRFFGFDSFEGLPETPTCARPNENTSKAAFAAGNYVCSREEFTNILIRNGVDMESVTLIPGFYSQTLTESLKRELAIEAAAIVNIDCDIYESTVDVLSFVTGFFRNGSLVLFDDWLAYDGHPRRGEQRACRRMARGESADSPHRVLQVHADRRGVHRQAYLNVAHQQKTRRRVHNGRRHDQRQASGIQSQWQRLGCAFGRSRGVLHA